VCVCVSQCVSVSQCVRLRDSVVAKLQASRQFVQEQEQGLSPLTPLDTQLSMAQMSLKMVAVGCRLSLQPRLFLNLMLQRSQQPVSLSKHTLCLPRCS